jgi:hypothetical protein
MMREAPQWPDRPHHDRRRLGVAALAVVAFGLAVLAGRQTAPDHEEEPTDAVAAMVPSEPFSDGSYLVVQGREYGLAPAPQGIVVDAGGFATVGITIANRSDERLHVEEVAVESATTGLSATGGALILADRLTKLVPASPGQVQAQSWPPASQLPIRPFDVEPDPSGVDPGTAVLLVVRLSAEAAGLGPITVRGTHLGRRFTDHVPTQVVLCTPAGRAAGQCRLADEAAAS